MDNGLQIFKSEEFGELRTVQVDDKIMFIAKDVAAMLGYSNTRSAISRHCRWVAKCDVPHPQGNGTLEMSIIPESDVYRLIAHSKLPKAQEFESWVFDEVLPSIRKNGMYMTDEVAKQAVDNPVEFLAHAVLIANDQIAALKAENEMMLPKAEFYDAVANSESLLSVGDVAKIINMGFGRNKLFKFLRERHILQRNNTPYQRYINSGYFKVIEYKYEYERDKGVRVTKITMVKQKGVDFILKLVKNNVSNDENEAA